MPKFKYIGKEPRTLAQVGDIKTGDVFDVTPAQAAAIEKNAPELYKPIGTPGPKKDQSKTDDPDSGGQK